MKEKNNIPSNWQLKKLGEVCIYSKGKKPQILKGEKSKEYSVPYINIKAFEKGIFAEYTNGVKCNLCNDDDLLMVWDGARCGLIGKAKKGAVGATLRIDNQDSVTYVMTAYFYKIHTTIVKKLKDYPIGRTD